MTFMCHVPTRVIEERMLIAIQRILLSIRWCVSEDDRLKPDIVSFDLLQLPMQRDLIREYNVHHSLLTDEARFFYGLLRGIIARLA